MKPKGIGILLVKIVLLAVLLLVLNGIGSSFLPGPEADVAGQVSETVGESAPAPPSGSFMALVISLMFLQTIALAFPVIRSKWSGWQLTLTVFLLYFGTVTFMSQIESLVYLGSKMPDGMLRGLFAMGFFTAAVFSPVMVLVLGKWKAGTAASETSGHREPTSAGEWAWKTAIGGLVFLSLYYLFGYFVAWKNPLLRDFYGGTDPGSFFAQMSGIVESTPWMLPFQYLRSLLWVGLAILVIRMMKGSWWQVALALSVLFTVPALYLLLPNPMMPDAVRTAHLVETAPYQFLFGWFVVWLFCRFGAGRHSPQTE